MDKTVEKYKLEGKFYIWIYTENKRNYSGWNFTADKRSFESLINLLEVMNNGEWPSKKSVSLDKPNDSQLLIPNNRNGLAKWYTKERVIFKFKMLEAPNLWLLKESNSEFEIIFGKNRLKELKSSLSRVLKGDGDFAMCDDSEEKILNFWWNQE